MKYSKFLTVLGLGLISFSGLVGCDEAKKPDVVVNCQIDNSMSKDTFFRTFFPFKDSENSWDSLKDGKVIVTIKSKFQKGDFLLDDMQMVPYIKSGNMYSPEYPNHWDYKKVDSGTNIDGKTVAKCVATLVAPKK